MTQERANQDCKLTIAVFKDVSVSAEGPCPWGVRPFQGPERDVAEMDSVT